LDRLANLAGVTSTKNPFATHLVFKGGTLAVGVVQFSQGPADVSDRCPLARSMRA